MHTPSYTAPIYPSAKITKMMSFSILTGVNRLEMHLLLDQLWAFMARGQRVVKYYYKSLDRGEGSIIIQRAHNQSQ